MFDQYTLKARLYPILILFFPVVVIGIIYSIQFESPAHFLISLGLSGSLSYFFSQLGRDQGKKKENELWDSWGGMPSVQILRFSDSTLDKHTKERYHRKLQILCPIATTLNVTDPHPELDEKYGAWSRFLISKTRDTKAFNLLFKENVSYGFRRNLWALKPIAIAIILCFLLFNYFYEVKQKSSFNPFELSDSFLSVAITLSVLLIVWLSIVNKDWVKLPAFAYAHRLCESSDTIN